MTLSLLKWLFGLALIAVIAMAFLSQKTFHVEVFIPAPPNVVWSVLMNTESYSEWNPVFIKVEGSYLQGSEVKNLVQEPDRTIEITANVAKLVPEKELNQIGGIVGVLSFDHKWLLQPVEGGTKVTQHEVDRGFWLWFWDSSWVQPAYEKASEALKTRVMQITN